jgi:hypothetical protein
MKYDIERTSLVVASVLGGALLAGAGAGPASAEPARTAIADNDDGRCPSDVPGARTSVKDTDEGVQVTITGKSGKAAREVQRRAKQIAATPQVAAAPRECVVAFYPGSQAAVETIPRGIRLNLTAVNPDDVDQIREKARARLAPESAPSEPAAAAPGSAETASPQK